MPPILEKCKQCGHDKYHNQLRRTNAGQMCDDCAEKLVVTHGESQLAKSRAAKATAWNNGEGWGNE